MVYGQTRSTEWQSCKQAPHLLKCCVLGGCEEMFSLALSQQNSARANWCSRFWFQKPQGFSNNIHGISSIDHGQTTSSRQHGIGKQHHATLNNHHQTRQTQCNGFFEHVYEISNSRALSLCSSINHEQPNINRIINNHGHETTSLSNND